MADQVLVLDPNPFFLSRNKQPHYGDRIEFATHIDRSLPIADAVALTASLAFLIDDDDALSAKLGELRGEKAPSEQAAEAEHTEDEPEGDPSAAAV